MRPTALSTFTKRVFLSELLDRYQSSAKIRTIHSEAASHFLHHVGEVLVDFEARQACLARDVGAPNCTGKEVNGFFEVLRFQLELDDALKILVCVKRCRSNNLCLLGCVRAALWRHCFVDEYNLEDFRILVVFELYAIDGVQWISTLNEVSVLAGYHVETVERVAIHTVEDV